MVQKYSHTPIIILQAISMYKISSLLLLALFVSNGFAQETPVKRYKDVIYTKHDGVALTMDVIKPKKSNGLGVISIVSGGWKSNHQGIGSGQPFIDRGYTVFYVVHGSQPRFIVEEIVADIHSAVKYIRSNAKTYGINPRKIGITGSSAGGHLSLMIATQLNRPNVPADEAAAKDPLSGVSSEVQAAAVFYPPTDYLSWGAEGDVAVGVGKLADYSAAFGRKSLTAEGREELGRKLSPIYGVHAGQPPVFIIHGDADSSVPIFQAYCFQKKCREVGADLELKVISGGGHGGSPNMKKDAELMADFFDRKLAGK